jgi:hypothetical protein
MRIDSVHNFGGEQSWQLSKLAYSDQGTDTFAFVDGVCLIFQIA